MTSAKATKRALISSVISLLLCFSMLLGTTFAWFTDTAVSAGNKIQAGTLKVELYQWTGVGEEFRTNISEEQKPVFDEGIRWEPGRTQVVYLSIKNRGNLALKYRVALDVSKPDSSVHSLTDVMEYKITPDAKYGDVTSWVVDDTVVDDVKLGTNETTANDVKLLPGEEHFFALSVHMNEEAGNKYMGESISFDIRVLAGQLVHENDSFGPNYDKFAGYPGKGYAAAITGDAVATEVLVTDDDGYKVGSALIDKDSVDPAADQYEVIIEKSDYKGNFTIEDGLEKIAYDVQVIGLKEDNDVPVKVKVKIPVGKDPETVKLYHYDTKVDKATYNPETGYVTFESTTFSPFTILYDAESVYVPPVVEPEVTPPALPEGCPTATVTNNPEYENIDLDWGSYGQWSPTKDLDSQLEAAYTFTCTETLDQAMENDFANWHCDFYVMLDKDLGANQIFLGGNYGSFGWVGFHNGELTLPANEEIPLLGSVTSNPWTYLEVVQSVGTFICGVGDVDDALSGATFTVMLRLTNPEDATEFYNVATINYTFE